MPILPPNWRDFVRRESVVAQREQSVAFIKREGLSAIALRGGTKIFDTTTRSLPHWTDLDLPAWQNWAVPLVASPADAWSDLDLDLKPGAGLAWDDRLKAEADWYFRLLAAALERFGPIDAPAYGRAFFGGRGHHLVHVQLLTPEDMDALRRLRMVKTVALGDLRLCLEVRVASAKGDPNKKAATLPGSVYERPDDKDELDLIRWRAEPPAGEGAKVVPTSLSFLHRACYAFLFVVAARAHWTDNNRHTAGLHFAGVLAHEVQAGFLLPEEAASVWDFLLERLADPDRKDREKILTDSIRAVERSQPVLGYTKLAELVGEEMQRALLRMRGGSDPDAITELYRRIVMVRKGQAGDTFIDLSGGADLYFEVPAETMARRYSHHPDFPPLPTKKGHSEIIRVVLASPRIQRVDGTVQMPGVPYGTRFWKDGEELIEATADAPAPGAAPIYINICAGLPAYDAPTEAEAARWADFWERHLEPLADGIEEQYDRLEQPIAWKIQNVRIKKPLGVALCGGQGIGKSALFDVILRSLYGSQLISKTAGFDLKERFRLQTLGNALFYVIEEVDFVGLDRQTHELFKNLNKNDTVPVEHKYGRKGNERNIAVPWFLTNSDDPRIIVDGKPERSLLVVKGRTQASMAISLKDWATYLRKIDHEVTEFAEALRTDGRLRNAGRHYFATLPLKEEVLVSAVEDTPAEHLRSSLDAVDQCLVSMLEEDMIRPNKADWSISGPFSYKMIQLGIEERMKIRGLRPGALNEQKIGYLFKKLFGGEDLIREKQVQIKDNNGGKPRVVRLRYLHFKLATMMEILQRNRGIEAVSLYELTETGVADEPSKEACEAAWEKTISPLSSGAY
jgi:hypothetical protein